ncbi:hypothetical protein JCGZ_25257 [Jatropha curcas]|uniref:indole-3-pyruvate monooxygenase n=1 Tax=Jatropha curcas TaxID=180498 RepID=A0A067L3M8_JATCU|nr:hypothetical protein JCGZ_25257 [Jatropha curcas]
MEIAYDLFNHGANTSIVARSPFKFGDVSKYGIGRPKEAPFYRKAVTGRSPTIDVGAMEKIKSGDIQVLPPIRKINRKEISFENGESNQYDAIIFATGYRGTVRNWLKGGKEVFKEKGMPTQSFPNHWKGINGIYYAGFSSMGLMGISSDAQNIARDISLFLIKDAKEIH